MPHVSRSWLSDHVEIPENVSARQIGEDLVRVGIEEEQIIPPKVTGPLVAGVVLEYSVQRHSNGKDIRYVRVDVDEHNDPPGTGAEPHQLPSRGIVCGAHNFEVGDTVVVALPGSVLPGPFPISSRKTYGHMSDGMIVSEAELGLGDNHSGIVVLNQKMVSSEVPSAGTDMIPILNLGEEVLEVNVTPDRGYCFAVRGLAREYAHSTGVKYRDMGLENTLEEGVPTSTEGSFGVVVDPDSQLEGRHASDRFVTRIVRGVNPNAVTPQWMVDRLEQAGMRSLSLPVDVTNYVMLDLGQPLHAYDLEFVEPPFVVRRANPSELFVALDGSNLELSDQDILITDSPGGERGTRTVGLAGVMGGLNSEVQNKTTDIVIEAAHFDSVSVARTSRRHHLYSESSKRFERGVDPELPVVAASRAVELIVKYGGGTAQNAMFDFNQVSPPTSTEMRVDQVKRIAGLELPVSKIINFLEAIGCTVRTIKQDTQTLTITPPTWRPDLTGPAHFVEEIARLHGYDNIGNRVPCAPGSAGLTDTQLMRRRASSALASVGLVEVLSYPFVSDTHDRQLIRHEDERRRAVRLANPLADDAAILRTRILDSLLQTAERNAARNVTPLALYELGQVTEGKPIEPSPILSTKNKPDPQQLKKLLAGVPEQSWRAAGVMGGTCAPTSGAQLESGSVGLGNWDWSDAIQVAKSVGEVNGVNIQASRTWLPNAEGKRYGPPTPPSVEDPADAAPWHPSRCATLFVRHSKSYVTVGYAGELHPKVVENFGLPTRSVAFEIDLSALEKVLPKGFLKVKPVSVFPPVKEDFAVTVKDSITEAEVASTIRRAAGSLLESLTLFDVYRGNQVPLGHRSLAYACTLRAPSHTLKTTEVEQVRQSIISALHKRLGAKLRE